MNEREIVELTSGEREQEMVRHLMTEHSFTAPYARQVVAELLQIWNRRPELKGLESLIGAISDRFQADVTITYERSEGRVHFDPYPMGDQATDD